MTTFEQKAPAIMRSLMVDFPELNRQDAAAILGNLGHESAGLTILQEIGKTPPSGGWGWAQWTGPRRREFERWTRARNLAPESDEANYGFLVHELRTTESRAIGAMAVVPDLVGKVRAFERSFERAGVKAYASRNEYARTALMAYEASTEPVQPQRPSPAPTQPYTPIPRPVPPPVPGDGLGEPEPRDDRGLSAVIWKAIAFGLWTLLVFLVVRFPEAAWKIAKWIVKSAWGLAKATGRGISNIIGGLRK